MSTETLTSSQLLSSDHNLLLSLIDVSIPKKETKTVVCSKCNYNHLKEVFEYDESNISTLSANECCNYLSNTIRDAMTACTTLKSIRLSSNDSAPPWADFKYHLLSKKASNLQMKKID